MSAEFILRSLNDKGKAKLQPLLDAIEEHLAEVRQAACTADAQAAEMNERATALEAGMRQVRGVLFSLQCGYFADPYNARSILSICGLADTCIFGVRGAPKDGSSIEEIALWAGQRLKEKRGWELLDALVVNKELSPPRAQCLLDKLQEAKPLMQERLESLDEYWESLTGERLTQEGCNDLIQYFKESHADMCKLLELSIRTGEPLQVLY